MSINCISNVFDEENKISSRAQVSNNIPKTVLSFMKIKTWELNDKRLDLYFNNKEFKVCIKTSNGRQLHVCEKMNCFQTIIGIPEEVKKMDIKEVHNFFKDTYVKIHHFGELYRVLISHRGEGGMYNYKVEHPSESEDDGYIPGDVEHINKDDDPDNKKLQIKGNVDLAIVFQTGLNNVNDQIKENSKKIDDAWDAVLKSNEEFRNLATSLLREVGLKQCTPDEKQKHFEVIKEIIEFSKIQIMKDSLDIIDDNVKKLKKCRDKVAEFGSKETFSIIDNAIKVRQSFIDQSMNVQKNELEIRGKRIDQELSKSKTELEYRISEIQESNKSKENDYEREQEALNEDHRRKQEALNEDHRRKQETLKEEHKHEQDVISLESQRHISEKEQEHRINVELKEAELKKALDLKQADIKMEEQKLKEKLAEIELSIRQDKIQIDYKQARKESLQKHFEQILNIHKERVETAMKLHVGRHIRVTDPKLNLEGESITEGLLEIERKGLFSSFWEKL